MKDMYSIPLYTGNEIRDRAMNLMSLRNKVVNETQRKAYDRMITQLINGPHILCTKEQAVEYYGRL